MVRYSFIIPVYNVAPYLRECLDSVLNQHLEDFEVCIVDDGSKDESGAICDEYASRDSRIKVKHQTNGGVSAARNAALEMATGEYIWFVDADDYIGGNSLAYIDNVILKSKCDTIFFGEERYKEDTGDVFFEEGEKHQFLCSHISYCNPLMIFKRSVIEENHLRFTLGMKMAEDLEFQYKYLLHCMKPVVIPYDFYYIRERGDSASRNETANLNNLQGNKMILRNMLEYVGSLDDKGLDWLGVRMAERVKSLMQAAALTSRSETSEVNHLVRQYIEQYKTLGYDGFNDYSFRLACIDVRIYYAMYKTILIIKGIKI